MKILTLTTDDKDGHTCQVFLTDAELNTAINIWLDGKWIDDLSGKRPDDAVDALSKYQQIDSQYLAWAEEHNVEPPKERPVPDNTAEPYKILTALPLDSEGKECTLTNHYHCPCGEVWTDQYSCACDDRCPECSTPISPHRSDDFYEKTPAKEPTQEGLRK